MKTEFKNVILEMLLNGTVTADLCRPAEQMNGVVMVEYRKLFG